MDIEVYTLEDAEGNEQMFESQDYKEARDRAENEKLRVIANVYEWSDSYMVNDFTGEG